MKERLSMIHKHFIKHPVFVFMTFVLLIPCYVIGQQIPGLTSEQTAAIIDHVSGERALKHIRHLALHHRWFVSDGYNKAAEYIKRHAIACGLKDVGVKKFISDGEVYYSTIRSLPKWTVKSAELSLVEPVKKHLVSWEENPITLASNSRSADVTAELVDVGEGVHPSDYAGKDIKGKIVLASAPQGKGRIDLVHRLAVLERDAAGVVSYRSYHLNDFPDLITWDHINTLSLNNKQSTFGFCISKRMGWELQRLLKQGEKVVLHARVDSRISSGYYHIPTGCIPGSDLAEQEIWFIAHLDHCRPSANDNASGSAAILETARTYLDLIEERILPPPRRTIRFFWVPEVWGTYAYIMNNTEETKKAKAVINMDMVGENQRLCGSVFRVTETPASTPSFLNDLLRMNLAYVLSQPPIISPLGSRDDWKAEVIPYSGGSDHYVFMGGVVQIPATMFGSWPDYFYHSSGDTPDKSDSTQLKRVISYGIMTAASIANMNTRSGLQLLDYMLHRSIERMTDDFQKAGDILRKEPLTEVNYKEALNILNFAFIREKGAIDSVTKLLPGSAAIRKTVQNNISHIKEEVELKRTFLEKKYRRLCQSRGIGTSELTLTKEEKAADRIIPCRNPRFPGPLTEDYFFEQLDQKNIDFDNLFTPLQLFEIGAFINGERSVLDIRNAVSAECGPIELPGVLKYLKILETIDLISLRKK